MPVIKILPSQVANQIAAGEVVERPSAVVKELLENAFDANATKVILEIDTAGSKRILVRDNGDGISKEELPLALKRHATSKLETIDDLDNLLSMGFRGEALASIAAVSRLTLTSKPAVQDAAYSIFVEGLDQKPEIKPSSHPDGTSIEVCDLFFNTPARRRFLRSEKTEFLKIEEIFKRLSLSRPDIELLFKNNGKTIYDLKSAQNEEQERKRLAKIMGARFAQSAIEINESSCGMLVKGYFDPCGSVKGGQYFFVNNRIVKDKVIVSAIKNALKLENYDNESSYVLFLEISPSDVDINVHPQKFEVRFANSKDVYDFISSVVVHAVRVSNQVLPETYEETINSDQNHGYLNYSSISVNKNKQESFLATLDNSSKDTNIYSSKEGNTFTNSDNKQKDYDKNSNSNIYQKMFSKSSFSKGNFASNNTNTRQDIKGSIFGKNSGFLGEDLCYSIVSQKRDQLQTLNTQENNQYLTNKDNHFNNENLSKHVAFNKNDILDAASFTSFCEQFLPWNVKDLGEGSIFKAINVYKLNYALIFGAGKLRVVKISVLAGYLFRMLITSSVDEPQLFEQCELKTPLKLKLKLSDLLLSKLSLLGFDITNSSSSVVVKSVPFVLRFSNLSKVLHVLLNKFSNKDNQNIENINEENLNIFNEEEVKNKIFEEVLSENFACFYTVSHVDTMLKQINYINFWLEHLSMSKEVDIDLVISQGFKND